MILRSQANLVASLAATWTETAREAARDILSRIPAEEAARTTREIRAGIAGLSPQTLQEAEAQFGARSSGAAGETVAFVCPARNVAALADWLISKGATRVSSARLDYVFEADNALWRRLAERLALNETKPG